MLAPDDTEEIGPKPLDYRPARLEARVATLLVGAGSDSTRFSWSAMGAPTSRLWLSHSCGLSEVYRCGVGWPTTRRNAPTAWTSGSVRTQSAPVLGDTYATGIAVHSDMFCVGPFSAFLNPDFRSW